MSLAHLDLETLARRCLDERTLAPGAASPASVELFRRAFAADQAAWALLQTLFEPLMRSWIGVQQHVEADDVLQEAYLLFYRFAPQRAELLAAGTTGPLLSYLRKTTKTALLLLLRKQRQPQHMDSLKQELPGLVYDDHAMLTIELRESIRPRISAAVHTPQEQIIFHLYFEQELKPREILARHNDLFPDISSINTIIQRLARRLKASLGDFQSYLDYDLPRARVEHAHRALSI
jgi:DNA-directed RNA polymerase specialized sigma24 family protein